MRHVHVVVLDAVVVVVVLFEYSIIRLFDYLPFLLSAVRGAGKREFIQDITVRESPTERRCGYFMFGVGIVSV